MILGVVMAVGGVASAQAGVHRVRQAGDEIRERGDDIRNGLLLEVNNPGSDTVDLDPGRYDVFAFSPADGSAPRRSTTTGPLTTDQTGTGTGTPDRSTEPDVIITGPDGREITTSGPSITTMFSAASGDLYATGSFRIQSAGTYRVETSGGEATKVGVGPALDSGSLGKFVTGGIQALISYVVMAIGIVLALAGFIWFLVSSQSGPRRGPGGIYAPVGGAELGLWPPASGAPWPPTSPGPPRGGPSWPPTATGQPPISQWQPGESWLPQDPAPGGEHRPPPPAPPPPPPSRG